MFSAGAAVPQVFVSEDKHRTPLAQPDHLPLHGFVPQRLRRRPRLQRSGSQKTPAESQGSQTLGQRQAGSSERGRRGVGLHTLLRAVPHRPAAVHIGPNQSHHGLPDPEEAVSGEGVDTSTDCAAPLLRPSSLLLPLRTFQTGFLQDVPLLQEPGSQRCRATGCTGNYANCDICTAGGCGESAWESLQHTYW